MVGNKPAVQRLLEAVAAVMELDGREELRLVFDGGRLTSWSRAELPHAPDELACFDEPVAERLARRLAPAA